MPNVGKSGGDKPYRAALVESTRPNAKASNNNSTKSDKANSGAAAKANQPSSKPSVPVAAANNNSNNVGKGKGLMRNENLPINSSVHHPTVSLSASATNSSSASSSASSVVNNHVNKQPVINFMCTSSIPQTESVAPTVVSNGNNDSNHPNSNGTSIFRSKRSLSAEFPSINPNQAPPPLFGGSSSVESMWSNLESNPGNHGAESQPPRARPTSNSFGGYSGPKLMPESSHWSLLQKVVEKNEDFPLAASTVKDVPGKTKSSRSFLQTIDDKFHPIGGLIRRNSQPDVLAAASFRMEAESSNAQPFIPLNAGMDKWFDDNNVNQYLDRSFMNELQQEGSQLSVAAKVKNGSCPVVGINNKSREPDVDDDANDLDITAITNAFSFTAIQSPSPPPSALPFASCSLTSSAADPIFPGTNSFPGGSFSSSNDVVYGAGMVAAEGKKDALASDPCVIFSPKAGGMTKAAESSSMFLSSTSNSDFGCSTKVSGSSPSTERSVSEPFIGGVVAPGGLVGPFYGSNSNANGKAATGAPSLPHSSQNFFQFKPANTAVTVAAAHPTAVATSSVSDNPTRITATPVIASSAPSGLVGVVANKPVVVNKQSVVPPVAVSAAAPVAKRGAYSEVEINRFATIELEQISGQIYGLCKDQYGCRYLQKKLEESVHDPSNPSLDTIFKHVYPNIIELMTDPFGNYLCQKLLEYCWDEQRTLIVKKVCEEIMRISLNMHGTRAVQKMIEYLSNPKQIEMVICALCSNVVTLIKDLNGNHVIQKCLNRFAAADNQFIFDDVTLHCVEVATHRHGCCVLQRCIDHASQEQQAQLVNEIIKTSLVLVQDPFGNYVVQYVLDLGNPVFEDNLIRQFVGHVCELSVQKFSSNVIEKCIRVASASLRRKLIEELTSEATLDKLLRDSFANYVVQTALDFADQAQRQRLVECIKPILPSIRSTPYGKRLFNKLNAGGGNHYQQQHSHHGGNHNNNHHHHHHNGHNSNGNSNHHH